MDGGKSPALSAGSNTRVESFILASSWTLGFEARKETADCFVSEYWGCRDSDLDRVLPQWQSHRPNDVVSVYRATRSRMTFPHMASAILGMPADTRLSVLADKLLLRAHDTPLCSLEHLVMVQECGTELGLQTLDRGNFAFVAGRDGDVWVLNLMRDMGEWHVHLHPFALDYGWGKPDRLLVRNWSAPALWC